MIEVHAVSTVMSAFDNWWRERGYKSNPFVWSNAAEVDEEAFPELFQSWYVEPNMLPTGLPPEESPTFTLDLAKSLETSALILIYVPAGGGKTFYRRWAAWQIKASSQHALEIRNLKEGISDSESVTVRDLALCIYKHVCDLCKQFRSTPPPGDGQAEHILRQCDDVIGRSLPQSQATKRVYVFVNDIDQLFDDHPSRAKQNAQALAAIVDFCKVAAMRGGGEPLALRMFIPTQLMEPIQRRLGLRQRRRIREYTISWSVEHCLDVVERRLYSYRELKDSSDIHFLLTKEERRELGKWLRQQDNISPRLVIDILDQFEHYVYSRGATTDKFIDRQLWHEFWKSRRPANPHIRGRRYPLDRSPFSAQKSQMSLWLALLLMLLVGGICSLSSPFRRFLGNILLLSANVVREIVTWLATVSDIIEALVLLATVLGSAAFIFWCLRESRRSSQDLDLRKCLVKAWQLICRHLPGGPK